MLSVKRLTLEDVDRHGAEILLLLKYCKESSSPQPFPEEFYEGKLSGLRSYLQQGRAVVFGAVQDQRLRGFLWGYPLDTLTGRNFHVAYIAVCPDSRGEGIGAALLCAAEDCAKEMGLSEMELIVSKENDQAVQVYHKQEYQTSRLIMKKKLDRT